jgi:citrate lyase subunit beta/citryl-CoA lyase/(S)-citramalyl-CoA lyase
MLNPRRCLLFVPGSRPERFEKALAADADQVCIDLEDAVPPAEKSSARDVALAFIARQISSRSEVGVRINPPATSDGKADLAAIARAAVQPAFVMIAKTESAEDVRAVATTLANVPLIALLESPTAIFNARDIAKASSSVQAMMFGGYDYAVAARVTPRSAGWNWPRAMLAAAAAEAVIGAMDVPSLEVTDESIVRAETESVIAEGFSARAAIHPSQVAVIQSCYLPSAAEAEHAERVIAASEAAAGGVCVIDGKMVDRPIELAARRAVALAAYGLRAA